MYFTPATSIAKLVHFLSFQDFSERGVSEELFGDNLSFTMESSLLLLTKMKAAQAEQFSPTLAVFPSSLTLKGLSIKSGTFCSLCLQVELLEGCQKESRMLCFSVFLPENP